MNPSIRSAWLVLSLWIAVIGFSGTAAAQTAGPRPAVGPNVFDMNPNPYEAAYVRAQWLTLAAYKELVDAMASLQLDRIIAALAGFLKQKAVLDALRPLYERFESEHQLSALVGVTMVGAEARGLLPGFVVLLSSKPAATKPPSFTYRRRFTTVGGKWTLVKHLVGGSTLVAEATKVGFLQVGGPVEVPIPPRPTGEPVMVRLVVDRDGGMLTGLVQARTGGAVGAIEGASVALTHKKTGRRYQTRSALVHATGKADVAGATAPQVRKARPSDYWLRGLPVGTYDLAITHRGYHPIIQPDGVTIRKDREIVRRDFILEPLPCNAGSPQATPLAPGSAASGDAESPLPGR